MLIVLARPGLGPGPGHCMWPVCTLQAGLFQAAGQLPWELTPVLGLITDACPLLGYRRKGYLLIVGFVGALAVATHVTQGAGVFLLRSAMCAVHGHACTDACALR